MNFPFIKPRESFVTSGLLDGMTDIHSHLLPDTDDGANTDGTAVEALRWLKDRGVRRMYLTPHVMSDLTENNRTYLTEQFDAFVKRLADDGLTEDLPELKLGAEYMLEAGFRRQLKDGPLTYADRHVLVETSYMMPPAGFGSLLEELEESGYTPVLAHPERYAYMDDRDYKLLKRDGVLFQLNYLSMTGAYGSGSRDRANRLLKGGYYDFAGSDFHSLPRHEYAFSVKALTAKNIAAIRQLMDNNNRLW